MWKNKITTTTQCWDVDVPGSCEPGLLKLVFNLNRLVLNGANMGLIEIVSVPHQTEYRLILKNPRFATFRSNLTQFEIKCDITEYVRLVSLIVCDVELGGNV